MPATRTHRRAFTLIEAVAAIVIVAVALPALAWTMGTAGRNRVDPILTSRARWLASERLEDIIADRHAPTRGYAYVIAGNYAAETTISGFAGFSRSVTVSESGPNLTAGSGTGYKTVTVTVSFTDSRNQSRSVALSTVLTDYTP